ncbi:MAG TPA: hypothetical protein VIL37_18185 [Natronosporangium sp.]
MRKLASVVTLALVTGLATACDEEPPMSVAVTSPVSGEVVTVPFEARFEATVPLGTSEAGLHHLHVWFGDDPNAYQVVEADAVEITIAPVGEHTMYVSLRNPDHSSTGVETSVPIVITGPAE